MTLDPKCRRSRKQSQSKTYEPQRSRTSRRPRTHWRSSTQTETAEETAEHMEQVSSDSNRKLPPKILTIQPRKSENLKIQRVFIQHSETAATTAAKAKELKLKTHRDTNQRQKNMTRKRQQKCSTTETGGGTNSPRGKLTRRSGDNLTQVRAIMSKQKTRPGERMELKSSNPTHKSIQIWTKKP